MKLINLIASLMCTVGTIVCFYKGETTIALLLLILAKLYTDGKG